MDMGHGSDDSSMGASCKISMLWNWYTVDACFISKDWHLRSVGAYVGTVFAIFFLVILIEGVRRMSREYDRRIVAHHYAMSSNSSVSKLGSNPVPFQPTLGQQAIRSLFHMIQFGAGYMTMLLAMYYNGGIILAIFAGAYFGHLLTARDTVAHGDNPHKEACCGA